MVRFIFDLLHFYRHAKIATNLDKVKSLHLQNGKVQNVIQIPPAFGAQRGNAFIPPAMAWAAPCLQVTGSIQFLLMWSPAKTVDKITYNIEIR